MAVAPEQVDQQVEQDAEPDSYRMFDVEVVGLRRLSPSFLRVTVTGRDLSDFADNGYDQRFKLVLPVAGCEPGAEFRHLPRGADWFLPWRELPPEQKNPVRTYTVRSVRRSRREVDFDVVLHGDDDHPGGSGPASRWAAGAGIADRLVLIGPNARHPGPHGGVAWNPPDRGRLLIAGDETAAPAIAAILERLPDDAHGHALLEVPRAEDALDEVTPPPGVELLWFFRGEAAPGSLLGPGLRELVGPAASTDGTFEEINLSDGEILWDVADSAQPQGAAYAWLAGEAGLVADLRRFLVRDAGLPRTAVASMGYWKIGVSGA